MTFGTKCLLCGRTVEIDDLNLRTPVVCEDCKQAVLWAKNHMRDENKINTPSSYANANEGWNVVYNLDDMCKLVFSTSSNLNRDTVREVCKILYTNGYCKLQSSTQPTTNESLGILGD